MVFNWLYRRKICCHFANFVSHFADTVSQTVLVTNVYLQVSTEDAMLMQIRALRDSDLQRDRLVQKLEWSRHVTRGRCGGLVTRACNPCYHVISLLYTSKTYSEVIPSFLFTFCVTIHYVSVCFIIYNINKSQSFFYISYLFMFFKCYITISYCLYYIYQTTDPCPVWGYLFNSGLYPTTVTPGSRA